MDWIYHTGHLVVDRDRKSVKTGMPTPAALAANEIADTMWQAYRRGKAILYQIRLGDGRYEYHCRVVKGT